jgi:hypothetical protein
MVFGGGEFERFSRFWGPGWISFPSLSSSNQSCASPRCLLFFFFFFFTSLICFFYISFSPRACLCVLLTPPSLPLSSPTPFPKNQQKKQISQSKTLWFLLCFPNPSTLVCVCVCVCVCVLVSPYRKVSQRGTLPRCGPDLEGNRCFRDRQRSTWALLGLGYVSSLPLYSFCFTFKRASTAPWSRPLNHLLEEKLPLGLFFGKSKEKKRTIKMFEAGIADTMTWQCDAMQTPSPGAYSIPYSDIHPNSTTIKFFYSLVHKPITTPHRAYYYITLAKSGVGRRGDGVPMSIHSKRERKAKTKFF